MELGRDPERAVASVAAARELLDRKAPAKHGHELRVWLYELANAVAQAASEGGFLGMGGEQVNAKERAILASIAQALGVQVLPDAAV
jgi:hypothetical protein